MITKETIQKYVFNKPKTHEIIFGLVSLQVVFTIMLISATFLSDELLLIGFISAGIIIGISLSLTKNIFFPILVVLSYNLTVIFFRNTFSSINLIDVFETIFRSIGDALFIVFVLYWVVIFSQYILAYFKNIRIKDEPITMNKFLLGSIVSGFLYGLMMVIQI